VERDGGRVRLIGTIARRGRVLLRRLFRRPQTNVGSEFLRLALQYYIAGRSACFAYSMPVAGNLLHHAVEMVLKHLLAEKGFSESELRYKFRHDLKKLWRATKSHLADPALDTYDPVIRTIARMYDVRSPRRGYSFQMSLRKEPTNPPTGSAAKGLRHYHLSLEDADELMTALLTRSTTPEWINGRLASGDARSQYLRENFHSVI
jgi:hypothetical protein